MDLTPVEHLKGVYFKRDDLYEVAGVHGGKARSCWHLAQTAKGLVTAGSRLSPQIKLVALIAKELGIPSRAHCPQGELGETLKEAQKAGCEIIQHKAGYNSVIIARAKQDAIDNPQYTYIPFGMECQEAINQTRKQVANLKGLDFDRIVIPVGSGMSVAGLLWGLHDFKIKVPVLGIVVGAGPEKRLNVYAPFNWDSVLTLQNAGLDYHKEAPVQNIAGINLDPIYEAKCVPFIKRNDLLWIVGNRR
jgi:1-aminocyclopropane-1-carboxylate deaminase/D-cysteine desulfhydrase-like pyridoxal-dependent ACC family enzyme